MKKEEMIVEYLENMVQKVGGDVMVYINGSGKIMMQRRGDPNRSVQVSLEEKRESFNRKVRMLMEG